MALCDLIGQTCKLRKDGRRQVCSEFYFAQKKGELVWNKVEEAWTLPTMKKRSMRSIEIKIRAGYDSTGYAYLLERCYFCGGEMPASKGRTQKLLPPGNPEE